MKKIILFSCIYFFVGYVFPQNFSCPSSTPCPISVCTYIDTLIYEIQDTILFGTPVIVVGDDGHIAAVSFSGQYLNDAFGGGMYKFRVKAGNTYVWDSSPNYREPDHTTFNTQLTLFYDDFSTPIIAQSGGGAGSTAKIIWRANYDGVVGLLVTRGESVYGNSECSATSSTDSVIINYYCLELNSSYFVFGRYSNEISVCGAYIYDSGLNDPGQYNVRNCYSDNEDGYTVVYPQDSMARLKLAGWYNLAQNDTLFVYEGPDPTYPLLGFCTGQSGVDGTTLEGAVTFVSPYVNWPMTLRMKSNGENVSSGFGLQAICCLPPALPEVNSLMGEMILDTIAKLTWWPSPSTDIEYFWTLFDDDGDVVDSGSTMETTVLVPDLTCNTEYMFSLRAYSVCLNEWAADTFWSAPFSYPYEIFLRAQDIVTSPLTICYGNPITVIYSFPSNVNVENSLTWSNNIALHDTILHATENGSFYTDPVTHDVMLRVTSVSQGGCIAYNSLNVFVIEHPEIDITIYPTDEYGNISMNEHEICHHDHLILQATGAFMYTWDAGFNTDTISISPDVNTTYIVTGTDLNFCSFTDTFTVFVNALPEVQLVAEYPEMCLWDSVCLFGSGLQYSTWQTVETVMMDSIVFRDSLFIPIYEEDTLVRIDTILLYDTLSVPHIVKTPLAEGVVDSMIVSPSQTMNYQILGVDTNGCVGMADLTIFIKDIPHVSISALDSSLCIGESTWLSVQSDIIDEYEYMWWEESQPDLVLSNEAELYINPLSSKVYYVRVSNRLGCDTLMFLSIEVNPLPEVSASIYPEHVCARHEVVLTGFGNNLQYRWDDISSQNPYSVFPEESRDYTVVGIDANGCRSVATVSIVVDESPIHEIVEDQHICLHNSVDLSVSGQVDNYQWYPSIGLSAVSGDSITANPLETTDYYVTYHTQNGCYDTTRFTVNVYEFPAPTISDNVTICRGDSAMLTAMGGRFFEWNDVNHSTEDSIWVTPDSTSVFTLTTYDHPNCYSTAQVEVSVIPYFPLSILSTYDSICEHSTVMLNAHAVPTNCTFAWNDGSQSPILNAVLDTTTTFSLVAYNPMTQCYRRVEKTISVMYRPVMMCSADTTEICSLDTVRLSVEGNAASYLWNMGLVDTAIIVTPFSSATYTVLGTSSSGCTSTASIDITVHSLPPNFNITVTPSTICFDQHAVITANVSNLNITQFYWSNPEIARDSYYYTYIPDNQSDNPYQDTVSVTITDENGCRNRASCVITVNPLPNDTLVGPESICIGQTATLLTTGLNSYYWYYPLNSTNSQVVDSPLQNTSYTVMVTNAYACSQTYSASVIVNPLPSISINSTNQYPYYCDNQQYILSVQGAESYLWSTGDIIDSIYIAPTQSMVYSVTGTDNNGCSASILYSLPVIAAPEISITALPNNVICAYDSLSLSVSGPVTTLLWNNGSVDNTMVISDLNSNTTFTVVGASYTSGTPCYGYDTLEVTVRDNPQLSVIQNSSPICANRTGNIVIEGADVYQWNYAPTLSGNSGDSMLVTPTAVDSAENLLYRVVGTYLESGCFSILEIPFVISMPPEISVSSSHSNNAVCDGDTLLLSACGGSVYRWYESDNQSVTLSNESQMSIVPWQNTTYTVYVENEAHCYDFASIPVVVNPNPNIEAIAQTPSICYGFSTTLNVLGNADVYQWNPSGVLDADLGETVIASPLTTTSITVTGIDTVTGCETRQVVDVHVNPSPQVTIETQNGICFGESVLLRANGANQYNWFYNDENNIIGTIADTITVEPLDLPFSLYGVVGVDENGCKDTTTIQVNVNAIPEINIQVSGDGYLCYGNGNYVGMTAQSNVSGMNYTWHADPESSTYTYWEELALALPDTTTTYTVTGTYSQYGATCTASQSYQLVVYPRPIVVATATPDTVCPNGEIILTATGAQRYIWSAPQVGTVGIGATQSVYPSGRTPYYVLGEDDNRCTYRDTVWVEVFDVPASVEISDNYVCANTPTELFLLGNNINYQWSPTTGLSDFTTHSVTVNLNENTQYLVTVTNWYGCIGEMEIPIWVKPTPNLLVTPDTTICLNNSITLEAEGGIRYEWDDGSTDNNRLVQPEQTSIYTVTAFNQYDCQTVEDIQISVIQMFDLDIRTSQDSFCLGETIRLTAYGAGDSYLWSNGSTDSTILVTPSETTTYSVTAFNNSVRCYHDVSHTLVQRVQPEFSLGENQINLCIHDTARIAIQASDYYSYEWNDGLTESYRTEVPLADVAYSVTATADNGCSAIQNLNIFVHLHPEVEIIVEDSAVCAGQELVLQSGGNAVSNIWNDVESTNQWSVIPDTSEWYFLTGYSEYGCSSKDSLYVIVHSLPIDSISLSDNDICPGNSVIMTTTGNNSCVWLHGDEVLTTMSDSVIVTPLQSSVYQCIYTNSAGCRDSSFVEVSVRPAPISEVIGDTVICLNTEVSLHITGNNSYLWSTQDTSNTIVVSPLQNTTYYVTSTNWYNCSKIDSIQIRLKPLFVMDIYSTFDTICPGDSVMLWLYGAGDDYLWNTGSSSDTIVVSPLITTQYSLTGHNNSTNCDRTVLHTVEVKPVPVFTVLGSSPSICTHDTIQLVADLENVEYQWNTGEHGSEITVSPHENTVYSVTATSPNRCTYSTTYTLEVNERPVVSIAASDTVACAGRSIQLTANGNALSYRWNTGFEGNTLTITQPSVQQYIVTAYSSEGCFAKDSILIAIHPNPTDMVNLSQNNICPGDTILLTTSGTNIYQWSPSTSLIQESINQVYAFPSQTTLYNCVYINEFGCKDSSQVLVQVRQGPNVQLTPNTTICLYDSIALTVSGGILYQWSTGNQNNTFTVSPTETTTYRVTVTNQFDCSAVEEVTINIFDPFLLSMQAERDTICLGESTMLSVYGAADNYLWNTGSNASQITVSPLQTTIYSVRGFNNTTTCGLTIYDTITVIQYPSFTVSELPIICENDTLCIGLQTADFEDVSWVSSPIGSIISGEESDSLVVSPSETSNYIYTVVNQYCTLVDSILVEVTPLPDFTGIEIFDDRCGQGIGYLHLTMDSNYPPLTFEWSDGSVQSDLSDLFAGSYGVTVTDARGCKSSAEDITVLNLPPPAFETVEIEQQYCDFGGSITVEVTSHTGNYTISWFADSLHNIAIPSQNPQEKLTGLQSGFYWTILEDDNCSVSTINYVPLYCNEQIDYYIPNAFTPNGDFNNIWRPFIPNMETNGYTYELFIYNRWGDQLFYSNNIEIGWDGQYKGKSVTIGTYVYVIILKDKFGQNVNHTPLTGSISVL